ncbi:MAG TPA: DUF2442 domain-containing protein [bacterium]|nr:DUF2442 domain-containing protein [bacterium]
MKKKSSKRGANTLALEAEVLNVSSNGLWLLVNDIEYFLPSAKFPWFKKANIVDICKVKLLHGYHLYWPSLDVDLELSSLEHLEKYPLVYR